MVSGHSNIADDFSDGFRARAAVLVGFRYGDLAGGGEQLAR